jgi:hypothetical protein
LLIYNGTGPNDPALQFATASDLTLTLAIASD